MDTRTCHQCDETKPITEFRENRNHPTGRLMSCNDCMAVAKTHTNGGRRTSYIDEDVSEKIEPRSGEWYVGRYGLDANDRQIAREAARRVIQYRLWYTSHLAQGHGEGYDSETAEDYVNRMMDGEPTKQRVRVLQTALAMALEDIDITTRTKAKMRKIRGAA